MSNSKVRNIIEPKQVLQINQKLRSLGLSSNLTGTKLINKSIQIIISSNIEFYILDNVLDEIVDIYPKFNKTQIRMAMKYALDNRNEQISRRNFEKLFGYEYDEYFFTTKNFIEEVVNLILLEK